MSFSIILPTLNEKGHIIDLINQISDICKYRKINYEIIVVDDSSTDGTFEIVENQTLVNKFLKLISRKGLKKNLAESINTGIKESKNDNIIWMDADLQHPPKYINEFIKFSEKFDAIISSRFLADSERYFNSDSSIKESNENQSYFFNQICKSILYKEITDYTSGFICIKKKIFENYTLKGFYGDYFINLIVHLKNNKKSILEIPFRDEKRATGFSKTLVSLNFRYLYTCFRYFLTLVICFFKKK